MVGKEGGLLLEREADIRGKGEYRVVVGKEVVSSWRGRETLGLREDTGLW